VKQWRPRRHRPVRQHGASAYRNSQCRCEICRKDATDQAKRERHARRERTAANGGVAPVEVHNGNTYKNWGCKCEACSADHARQLTRYRSAR
jgi:hypothetical protein